MKKLGTIFSKLESLIRSSLVLKISITYAFLAISTEIFIYYKFGLNIWKSYDLIVIGGLYYGLINLWAFRLMVNIKNNEDKISKLKINDNQLLRVNAKTTSVKDKINLDKSTLDEINRVIVLTQCIIAFITCLYFIFGNII